MKLLLNSVKYKIYQRRLKKKNCNLGINLQTFKNNSDKECTIKDYVAQIGWNLNLKDSKKYIRGPRWKEEQIKVQS